jgi:hypothetical protein
MSYEYGKSGVILKYYSSTAHENLGISQTKANGYVARNELVTSTLYLLARRRHQRHHADNNWPLFAFVQNPKHKSL